ncbi:MAG: hypothetical protein J6S69_04685 [Proteobacteria bacterium]|nr:hypothetical protein [Pseudomonadota bacterium]
MNTQDIVQKLRRLHTLLVLGKRSNNLALAIRRALDAIDAWPEDARVMVQKTPVRILFAGYGPKFIKLFEELLKTGDIAMIHQLQPEFDPFFCYLCEIPGIGETMARRMYFDRSIRSMDDLRIAYSNNILQRIPSFGDIRLKAIEDVLWISQARDDSPADIPAPTPSQLALPSIYPRHNMSGSYPHFSGGHEMTPALEYTKSYGQTYDSFTDLETNEEEDLFEPTPRHANISQTNMPQPYDGHSQDLFQPELSVQNSMNGRIPSSKTGLRSLPGLGAAETAKRTISQPNTTERVDTPSLAVFNAIPASAVQRTTPVQDMRPGTAISASVQDMRPIASASEIHHAIARTIQNQDNQPENALVKSQLEAFIAQDLKEHGLLSAPEARMQNLETQKAYPMGYTDEARMACEACHSGAKASYEAKGRIEAETNLAQRMACEACHSEAAASYEAKGRIEAAPEHPSSCTIIRTETLHAAEIITDELVATLLKCDVLIAENIQIDRRMPEMPENAQAEMKTDKLSASAIYADSITAQIVRVKTVRVRYLISQVIRG